MTKVVNLRRESYDVYIGRAGHGHDGYFGNPFVVGRDGDLSDVLQLYSAYFHERVAADERFARRALNLHGKVLGCFCKPAACHGDVIATWVDAQYPQPRSFAEWRRDNVTPFSGEVRSTEETP